MKIIGISLVLMLFMSCISTSYFQIYQVERSNGSPADNSSDLTFEDSNCKIIYNIWSQGGKTGFTFENKTDSDIYIKLNKSHFILNGFAYDYYQNRTYTNSKSSAVSASAAVNNLNITKSQVNGKSVTAGLSSGYSVSITEDSVLCIPSKSMKSISEFSLRNETILDCDLSKYPQRIETKLFDAEKTPLSFSNRLTYELSGVVVRVNNDFYVSSVTNCSYDEFYDVGYMSTCGKKNSYPTKTFKYYSPSKFYVEYNYGNY